MGLLVCSYGMFGVQIWGFWCAVMGDYGKLGVQIWDFQASKNRGVFYMVYRYGAFGVQLWESVSKF
jgi:hypothetical protein